MTELKFKDIRREPYLLEYFFIYAQLTSAPVISQEKFIYIMRNLPKNHYIFVCYLRDKVVGMITVLIEQKLTNGGKCVAHVEDVVVDNQHRGLGIGKSMIQFAVGYAQGKNCYKIILNCREDLREFYQKEGFIKHSEGMAIYFN
jgi:glucosamine-phosphate N-acetyltransferase